MKNKGKAGYGLLMGVAVVLCMTGAACNEKRQGVEKPVQNAWVMYEPENVQTYTIDADGNLYWFDESYSDDAERSRQLTLEKYDKKGEHIFSRSFCDGELYTLTAMCEKNGVLYFACEGIDQEKGMNCISVYAYQVETEELSLLQKFDCFLRAKRLVIVENVLYLLGSRERLYSSSTEGYRYRGEKIVGYDLDSGEIFELGVEEPIDMSAGEDGELILYVYMNESFCFMSYDITAETAEVLAKTDVYKTNVMTAYNQGESVLYYSTHYGLVTSELSEFEVESELYPDISFWDSNLCIVNGQVACMTQDRKIVQFCLDDVKQENQTIRYIYTGYEPEMPYGCGYEIKRTELEKDKFALKIMALDKDFDVCLVDTSDSFSYNLKKNGVFYPLNDVPGVQEYLDECFPYVRKAATEEDGTVWMLPIQVDLPLLAMDELTANRYGIGLNTDMTYEEYYYAHGGLDEEIWRQIDIASYAFYEDFFRQYFTYYTSVHTEVFRRTLEHFAENVNHITSSESEVPLYLYSIGENSLLKQYVRNVTGDVRVYEVPKVSADSKNVGTCLFLAVNPYSDNLDATLDYIASWIAYTMEREDIPLFFKDRAAGDSVYESSLYELYQNGEIGFTLDADIYAGYEAVLEDSSKLEAYIEETERKLKIYLNE